MRVSKRIVVAFLIAVLATPALAKPAVSPGLKPQFQALYSRMDDATRHYDLAGFMSLYDSQFISHGVDQSTTYIAGYRQNIAETFRIQKFLNPITTVQSVKPWKNGVIVYAHTHETYESPDKYKPSVLLHDIYEESDEDYWVKRGNSWKMREEIELSENLWENGQLYK